MTRSVVAVVALAACSSSPDARELATEIDALATTYQAQLDVLVARVQHTKDAIHGNPPGWEYAQRTAESANDQLGLPPYFSQVPAGPERIIPYGSLLGIGPDVRKRVPKLVQANDTAQLSRILADMQLRYFRYIIRVSADLDEVEYWLAHPGATMPWQI